MQRPLKSILNSTSVVAGVLFACGFAFSGTAYAASIDDLRQKITENSQKIEEIQKQIDQYSSLLNSTSKEAQTLKSALSTLEITQKKLEANLKLTSTQISKTSLTLEELGGDIADAEKKISSTSAAVALNMRNLNMAESESAIEELLKNKSMSETWDYINALKSFEGRVKMELSDLRDLRELLGAKRDAALGEKTKLESYKRTLADQTQVVLSTKGEKDKLLKDTQNKESTYKNILAEKIKEREAFEKALRDYESELKITLDPSAVPGPRSGIISWPLDDIVVTQYFGYTAAAAKLYRTTQKHGGVDFRASIGTQVKAALSGTVMDTEAVRHKRGCQYGKFVLIKHANGLSTIYGHLSVVSVNPGDVVLTGDVIGYSGDTGYATGPHLHFGLYATQGIRIVDSRDLSGTSACAGIKTVAATPAAYLDPHAYLPKN